MPNGYVTDNAQISAINVLDSASIENVASPVEETQASFYVRGRRVESPNEVVNGPVGSYFLSSNGLAMMFKSPLTGKARFKVCQSEVKDAAGEEWLRVNGPSATECVECFQHRTLVFVNGHFVITSAPKADWLFNLLHEKMS